MDALYFSYTVIPNHWWLGRKKYELRTLLQNTDFHWNLFHTAIQSLKTLFGYGHFLGENKYESLPRNAVIFQPSMDVTNLHDLENQAQFFFTVFSAKAQGSLAEFSIDKAKDEILFSFGQNFFWPGVKFLTYASSSSPHHMWCPNFRQLWVQVKIDRLLCWSSILLYIKSRGV